MRKHGLASLMSDDTPLALTAAEQQEFLTLMRITPYHHVETRGFPPYVLTNLSGNIKRNKDRLSALTAAAAPGPAVRWGAGDTATARAGLTLVPGMTTPQRSSKRPKPIWTAVGNVAMWKPLLLELGATDYRGIVSFWDDPTDALETALLREEAATGAAGGTDLPGPGAEAPA